MSGLDDVTTFVVLSRDICDAVDLEVDDREDRSGGVVVEVIGPELVPFGLALLTGFFVGSGLVIVDGVVAAAEES